MLGSLGLGWVVPGDLLSDQVNRRGLLLLLDLGLGYLTLERSTPTLSPGELQRLRLATQVHSNLFGVVYVLDEPSIGLHQRDNELLIRSLKNLRDIGNTVIVVEHDQETIESADWVIDIGPGAGKHGGEAAAGDQHRHAHQGHEPDVGPRPGPGLRGETDPRLDEEGVAEQPDHAAGVAGGVSRSG